MYEEQYTEYPKFNYGQSDDPIIGELISYGDVYNAKVVGEGVENRKIVAGQPLYAISVDVDGLKVCDIVSLQADFDTNPSDFGQIKMIVTTTKNFEIGEIKEGDEIPVCFEARVVADEVITRNFGIKYATQFVTAKSRLVVVPPKEQV